uniref:NADH dehydrogenase [ubiquinone] iron-sulfur protein 6, mitochondrial n=1 Tax=Accipiter nisus TaxID=211598 RepID=A0A8B9NDN8_9AVES
HLAIFTALRVGGADGRKHMQELLKVTVVELLGEMVNSTCFLFEWGRYLKACFFLLQVNKNFAIDLIAEQPVSEVESRVISCDGGGGALGHPKVYINLDKDTKTGTCGYCGLQFKQKHH